MIFDISLHNVVVDQKNWLEIRDTLEIHIDTCSIVKEALGFKPESRTILTFSLRSNHTPLKPIVTLC